MKALYLLSFILFVGVNAYSHQIELRVLDEKGNPLEKAKIYQPNYSETKKDGIFFIPADSDFVFLHKETFKPKLIFVEKIKNNSVLLEKELKSVQLLIKNCPRRKMKSKGWFDILIPNPRGFGRKTGKDIDYAVFFISKKRGNKEEYLQGISGPHASGLLPSKDLISKTKMINARSVVDENFRFIGFDLFGKTKEFVHWRKISVFMDHFYYSVKDIGLKDVFDRTLDNSCSRLTRREE